MKLDSTLFFSSFSLFIFFLILLSIDIWKVEADINFDFSLPLQERKKPRILGETSLMLIKQRRNNSDTISCPSILRRRCFEVG